MVDGPSNYDTQQAAPVVQDKPANAVSAFLATTTGKLVVGGIALVVVLGIVGFVVWTFLLGGSSGSQTVATSGVVATGTVPASTSATANAPITEPAEKPLESTFTFRNIFAPTLKQQFAPTESASSGSSTSGSTSGSTSTSTSTSTTPSIPADTLYLQSIQTVDGKTTATFLWNGQSYTLAEGESIPDSPWKVLSIGSDSVVMLFGDTEVTLSLGQGLTK